MRSLRFLPLTYLAGVHGFAAFVPYLVVCLVIQRWVRRRRRLRAERQAAQEKAQGEALGVGFDPMLAGAQ